MTTVLRRAGYRDVVVPKESAEQKRLFAWSRMEARRIPELALMYSVPNGGSRHSAEASNLKAEGVKAGVPDIHLPVRRQQFNGLYIELKRTAFALPETGYTKWGTVSAEQLQWLAALNAAGSHAVICRGYIHARDTVLAFLSGDSEQLEKLNMWWVQMPDTRRDSVTKTKSITRKKRATRSRRV